MVPARSEDSPRDTTPPTQGTLRPSHYRMTLHAVGESLTGFASSREFVGAIADAMEGMYDRSITRIYDSEFLATAHDDAYFAARILHRDISVGNILFADNKKGMLVDWDRCVDSDNVGARRPLRMVRRRLTLLQLLRSDF
jgi:hypothetical protein